MKKTITPGATPQIWDPETLYSKAVRYVQCMGELSSDDWQYALWSSLSLEFLARAALANVSPTLLAENDKSWSNLYHALGFTPTEERFNPQSIVITEVFKRLMAILPDFTAEQEKFCKQHIGRRNAELHSGETAFEGSNVAEWQPRFYQTCQVLLASMGMTLKDFVGKDESKIAEKLIAAAVDESAKAVKGDVEAHKKVWLAKGDAERTTLAAQASLWAARHAGHRVECPACKSVALVVGEPVTPPVRRLVDDEITETQEHLPSQFECIACSLKISGLSRLAVVGLANRYKRTQVYDAAEFYAPEDDYDGYEDDNNER